MSGTIRFERRMSDADALLWRNEKDPLLRSTITAIALLDRAPDRALLIDRLERASRVIPRLRQRVVSTPLSIAPPRWEIDPHFDLRYHVRWFKAPGDGSLDDVLAAAEPLAMQGFDRARPLWELVVLEGLADGHAATILKLHHAITDGIGAVQIAMNLFDLERHSDADRAPMPPAPTEQVTGLPARMADALDHESRRLLGIAKRLPATFSKGARAARSDPIEAARQMAATAASASRMLALTPKPLSPILSARSLSVRFDALSAPLDELKAAARLADGRLNDAFVAAVIGGLHRYHLQHGAPVRTLRMGMPINVRGEDRSDLAGNAFAPVRTLVPLDITDPVERMRAVRAMVSGLRAEPALALLEPMALVVHRLPTTLSTLMFQSMLRGQDFIASNVPGVPIPVFFAGAAIVAQYPFGPLSGAAANLTLLSYRDQVHVGISTDPAAIPDRQVLMACLQESFDEFRKLV